MIGTAASSILGTAATKRAAQRLHDVARAELIKDGDRLRAMEEPVEKYDRTERKDFWNDPERWEGIEDPHKQMIWEVRRPDVIDVRPAPAPPPNPYANAQPQQLSQLALMQSSLLNQYRQQPGYFSPFGNLLGRY